MPSLIVAFREWVEIILSILRVSNITVYGTGKIFRKIKVFSVIKNAPVSLVWSLMIKVILSQEVPILRFTSGMEIRSKPL